MAGGDVTASYLRWIEVSLYFRRTEVEISVAARFCLGNHGESSLYKISRLLDFLLFVQIISKSLSANYQIVVLSKLRIFLIPTILSPLVLASRCDRNHRPHPHLRH
jgi:hypothetical protein